MFKRKVMNGQTSPTASLVTAATIALLALGFSRSRIGTH
jgi:hypothetical protein